MNEWLKRKAVGVKKKAKFVYDAKSFKYHWSASQDTHNFQDALSKKL